MRIVTACLAPVLALLVGCGGGGGGVPAGPNTWLKASAGSGVKHVGDAAVFPDGSVVVAGRLNGAGTFGAGEPGEQLLSSAGSSDAFLARYAPNGTLQWAASIGGGGSDEALVVAAADDGRTFVGGRITNGAVYASGQPNSVSVGGETILLACYASDGTLVWATRTTGQAWCEGIVAHADGTITASGTFGFNSNVTFGPGETNQTILVGQLRSIFVARFDGATGALISVRMDMRIGNALGARAAGLPNGNVVISGLFQNTGVFNEGVPGQASISSGAQFGGYVARYHSNGAFAWARTPTSSGARLHFDNVAPLGNGAVAISGTLESASAIFGDGESAQTTLTATDTVLITAIYEADGSLRWARGSTSTVAGNSHSGDAVTGASGGRIAMSGRFSGTQVFGQGGPSPSTITASNGSTAYISFYDETTGAHVHSAAAVGSGEGASLRSFPGGHLMWAGKATGSLQLPGTSTLLTVSSTDIFVGRFDLASLLP